MLVRFFWNVRQPQQIFAESDPFHAAAPCSSCYGPPVASVSSLGFALSENSLKASPSPVVDIHIQWEGAHERPGCSVSMSSASAFSLRTDLILICGLVPSVLLLLIDVGN